MMKPPFKVSCVVKLYKHDFEVKKYISNVMPTCAISMWHEGGAQ